MWSPREENGGVELYNNNKNTNQSTWLTPTIPRYVFKRDSTLLAALAIVKYIMLLILIFMKDRGRTEAIFEALTIHIINFLWGLVLSGKHTSLIW